MHQRRIIIYGHGDKSAEGFPTEEAIKEYLAHDIFDKYKGRYQYSQQKLADIILLSRDGLIYGHFKISRMEKPNENDKKIYPPVRKTYIVGESSLYQNQVALSSLNIEKIQFGKSISEQEFETIKKLAGKIELAISR
ncbi:MAG: hypothetical protein ABJB05_02540 [Parafilimonas sp.]